MHKADLPIEISGNLPIQTLTREVFERAALYALAEVSTLDDTVNNNNVRPFLRRLSSWARGLEKRLEDQVTTSTQRRIEAGADLTAVERENHLAAAAVVVAQDCLRQAVAGTRSVLKCKFLALVKPGWSPQLILANRAFQALQRVAAQWGAELELPSTQSVIEVRLRQEATASAHRPGSRRKSTIRRSGF